MFWTFQSAVINFHTNLQFLYNSDYSSAEQINAITVKYLVGIIVKFSFGIYTKYRLVYTHVPIWVKNTTPIETLTFFYFVGWQLDNLIMKISYLESLLNIVYKTFKTKSQSKCKYFFLDWKQETTMHCKSAENIHRHWNKSQKAGQKVTDRYHQSKQGFCFAIWSKITLEICERRMPYLIYGHHILSMTKHQLLVLGHKERYTEKYNVINHWPIKIWIFFLLLFMKMWPYIFQRQMPKFVKPYLWNYIYDTYNQLFLLTDVRYVLIVYIS